MANRSYLYTCDAVPGGKTFHARGLSEFAWNIPLVHALMMAGSPRIVRSAIWDHDIGILAEREGAFARTVAFLDTLAAGKLPQRDELVDELAELKKFLAKVPDSRYLLLEAGEIFDMLDSDLGALARSFVAQIPRLAEKAERAIAGKEPKWLAEMRKKWRDEVGPGEFSHSLYFDFPAPRKKPAAKPKAATKPKANPAKPKPAPTPKPAPKPTPKPKPKPSGA